MPYCPNCGASNGENAAFCNNCGARLQNPTVSTEPQQPADNAQIPLYKQPLTQNSVPTVSTGGLMAWAIITLLLCTIPGIIAIVNVAGVNKCASVEEQNKKLSTAKICCIVGTVLGVLAVIGNLGMMS